MYDRILVAIDGSRTGDVALTEAVRLAKVHAATLRIVHVIDVVGFEGDVVPLDDFRALRMKAGRAILDEAAAFSRGAGLRVETRLLEIDDSAQRIVEVLAEEAKAWPADLAVIGTHGRRGLNRLMLGSVAEEFARVAAEPVLLVRETRSE
jgi:nucleotide-binding universal stress UspA family protein